MNRERRRHPISSYLPSLEVSKKSVIPPNQVKTNRSVNQKTISKRKADRHM